MVDQLNLGRLSGGKGFWGREGNLALFFEATKDAPWSRVGALELSFREVLSKQEFSLFYSRFVIPALTESAASKPSSVAPSNKGPRRLINPSRSRKKLVLSDRHSPASRLPTGSAKSGLRLTSPQLARQRERYQTRALKPIKAIRGRRHSH